MRSPSLPSDNPPDRNTPRPDNGLNNDIFDPLSALNGFRARQRLEPSPPASELQQTGIPPTPGTTSSVLPVAPFGSLKNGRVRYTVLLNEALAKSVKERMNQLIRPMSIGDLAYEAITTQFGQIVQTLRPFEGPDNGNLRSYKPCALDTGGTRHRQTLRLTIDQANTVEQLRQRLGFIEISSLHRYALTLHLVPDESPAHR